MPNTMTLIASITVGAGGASVMEFTSIPNTYTDLVVKFSGRDNDSRTLHNIELRFNNSSTGYTGKSLYGDGSTTGSGGIASSTWMQGTYLNGAASTANTFSNVEIYIPNYAGSNNKSISFDTVIEDNSSAGALIMLAGLWSNSAAITSIKFTSIDGATILQNSTAYLYGIKNS
jgi:hypothetical protein